ncbi:Uncharacterized protein Adt_23822 [Abeliophyllum distichum]|uniref:Uncharacterized protein n=1 Tax=Abeliophyllum distichum TaxID=126358 RepID=A0ABD1SBY2_9LAMI
MEDAKDLKENGSLESSTAPLASVPDNDQWASDAPTTQNTNGKVDSEHQGSMEEVSELAPLKDGFDAANLEEKSRSADNNFDTPSVVQETLDVDTLKPQKEEKVEAKIVIQSSQEDDSFSKAQIREDKLSVSSPQAINGSASHLVPEASTDSDSTPKSTARSKQHMYMDVNRGKIDTDSAY